MSQVLRRWVLPWLAALPAAAWALVRLAGWDTRYPVAQLVTFTPYMTLGGMLPLLALLWWRRWAAACLAGLAVAVLAAVVLPRGLPDPDPLAGAAGPRLRVLTANVWRGSAVSGELVALVREHRIDVLALQEVSPEFLAEADAAGLKELLPHRVDYSTPDASGSAVLSRVPLRNNGVRINPGGWRQARAILDMPDGGVVLVESVHLQAPWVKAGTPLWAGGYGNQPPARPSGPARVLLGDFNSSLDHHLLRDLIGSGYRDAADVTGHGLVGTWGPYGGDLIPPVALDRVLAEQRVGIADFRVLDLHGTDHLPVFAELVLPGQAPG
ncbi:endonuclease/exonuclease/phosphatase family protein [Catellatospora citrea]|uniref:Endonuclease n=1 Tax=Catellatospora citrea TaxID=53366 RepID=A0A8J3KNU3_9ACTN|nr:endonuclease/exonuclease/phosphatase family protein [Catellatospora citrea]RKE10645.1 endonuclease/exonuclease/phosphatase family metal-dependent hydrolase [Catellatospora citrea]GIG03277.1 endonuclease [Catellatospora citrea]